MFRERTLLTIAVLAASIGLFLPGYASADDVLVVKNRYVVSRVPTAAANGSNSDFNGIADKVNTIGKIGAIEFSSIKLKISAANGSEENQVVPYDKSVADAWCDALGAGVITCEPEYVFFAENAPNDPLYTEQWMHQSIRSEQAWDIGKDASGVVVAVVDTGVRYDHPDLAPNIWTNAGEIPNNGLDDDANGYVDDVYGWDFANSDSNPIDDHFHGTHVAGIIGAAGDNGVGVSGVAQNVQLMSIKVLSAGGSGYYSWIINGMLYAIRNGAKVINMSLGGGFPGDANLSAMNFAAQLAFDNNALIVAAAGNSNQNTDTYPHYPSNLANDSVISVASVDSDGSKSSFSNYGANTVDIAAPGGYKRTTFVRQGIMSTWNTGYSQPAYGTQYARISGTSMAAPVVAGAAALMWGIRPELSNMEVRNILLGTSVANEIESVAGSLDLYAAASAALTGKTGPSRSLLAAGKLSKKSGAVLNGKVQEGKWAEFRTSESSADAGQQEDYTLSVSFKNRKGKILGTCDLGAYDSSVVQGKLKKIARVKELSVTVNEGAFKSSPLTVKVRGKKGTRKVSVKNMCRQMQKKFSQQ